MKSCHCGGKLYRHDNTPIKGTGEVKRRYRCNDCGEIVSYYSIDGKFWVRESRPAGRSGFND